MPIVSGKTALPASGDRRRVAAPPRN